MVKLQKISKRQPLKQKYSILKKIAAHKKKLKKIIKRTNISKRRITRKGLSIPNCLFKKSILENVKRAKEIKQQKMIGECKQVLISDVNDVNIKNVIQQITDAYKEENEKEKEKENKNQEIIKEVESFLGDLNFNRYVNLSTNYKNAIFEIAKKKYYDKLKKKYKYIDTLLDVIKSCDAFFYIVDVRNPLFYIHSDIVEFIRSCKKEIILVLNKCDLVDNEIIKQWCYYFRNYFVTIPFVSFKTNIPPYLKKKKNRKYFAFNGDPQNYNTFFKSFFKSLFKDMIVTLGIIGNVYVGKNSFMKSVTYDLSYATYLQHNKSATLPIMENISLYKKNGLILSEVLTGFETIKKVHILNKNELTQLLKKFLSAMSLADLIHVFKKGNDLNTVSKLEKLIIQKQKNIQNYNIDYSKNKYIDEYLFADAKKKQLIKRNVQNIYQLLFANEVLYYIVPGNKLVTPNHINYEHSFQNLVQLYEQIDQFILEQPKKGTEYIMLNFDDLIEGDEVNEKEEEEEEEEEIEEEEEEEEIEEEEEEEEEEIEEEEEEEKREQELQDYI